MRCDGELIASIALWATLAATAQTHQVPADQVKQADTAFKAGYAALTSNDLQTAREDSQKVVKLVPQIEEGHSALGAVLLQLNLFPEAIAELKRALKLKPEDAPRKQTWPWPMPEAIAIPRLSPYLPQWSGMPLRKGKACPSISKPKLPPNAKPLPTSRAWR
jgi:tetratricopeptide (TPR) repeat protein